MVTLVLVGMNWSRLEHAVIVAGSVAMVMIWRPMDVRELDGSASGLSLWSNRRRHRTRCGRSHAMWPWAGQKTHDKKNEVADETLAMISVSCKSAEQMLLLMEILESPSSRDSDE